MQFIAMSVHGKGGSMIGLNDLLRKILDNGLSWYILYFEGVGRSPEAWAYPISSKSFRRCKVGMP